jgi:hypothetical protein
MPFEQRRLAGAVLADHDANRAIEDEKPWQRLFSCKIPERTAALKRS